MKVHVLTGNDAGDYVIVVHGPVPGGANAVGISWSDCLIASGRNVSILTVGNGPAQTTQAEINSIVAGTTIEVIGTYRDDETITTQAQRTALLDAQATAQLAEASRKLAQEYRFYGATRA